MTPHPRAAVAAAVGDLTAAGPRTLLVIPDDDVPSSSGRRAGAPDDDEMVQVQLVRPLPAGRR